MYLLCCVCSPLPYCGRTLIAGSAELSDSLYHGRTARVIFVDTLWISLVYDEHLEISEDELLLIYIYE